MAAELAEPPRDLTAIQQSEDALLLPTFTADTAWTIGSLLRTRLLALPQSTVISITHANSNQFLFHAATHSSSVPDNDTWVARKRATVLRWGHSTWYMHNKFGGDEARFRETFVLGERAGEFAIHGGGWPVRVKGVQGTVGVIVVSGLKQEWDHQVIVEVLSEYLAKEK